MHRPWHRLLSDETRDGVDVRHGSSTSCTVVGLKRWRSGHQNLYYKDVDVHAMARNVDNVWMGTWKSLRRRDERRGLPHIASCTKVTERNLLREVQDAALDPAQSVADVLRKCLLLAYPLGNREFREWAEHELEGYPPTATLPLYRIAHGDIYAALSGPLQGWVPSVPVPLSELSEDHRESLRDFSFRQSVAELAALADGASGRLMRPLPMELCRKVTVYVGWSTVRMWSEISDSKVKGVLDIVRTRALKFALELQAASPTGESGSNVATIPAPVVHQVFQTVIQGGVVNLAQGSASVTQEAAWIKTGDVTTLRAWVLEQGATAEELAELERLIGADRKAEAITPATEGWALRVAKRLAGGAGRAAEAALTSALTAGIKTFLGLP